MRCVLVFLATCLVAAGMPSAQDRRTDPDATRIQAAHTAAKIVPSRRIGADSLDHRVALHAAVVAAFALETPPRLTSVEPTLSWARPFVPIVLARSSRGPPAARFAI